MTDNLFFTFMVISWTTSIFCYLPFCSLSEKEISSLGACALSEGLRVNQSLQELEWVELPYSGYFLWGKKDFAEPWSIVLPEFPTLQSVYEGDVCKCRKYWTCEKMKMSGGLLGGRSRHQGDLWTARNQTIENTRLQFDLWPLKTKRSGAEGNY